ncbi:hypothetical protein EAS62_38935 [Bradyrhizobium zhanjiangense]|uniref:Transposase n=1 Tax=Bradyrhizobium zhanjiangense TaxID=1325107 RepID=A0ABY0D8W9_9BRAD|nr:hypothetical protein EAS62_38935 [Bradyrhizobium zhanjiangense]
MRHSDSHCEWIAHAACLFWKFSYKFIGMDRGDAAALPHRTLERHLKIDDLQLVLDEWSACVPIASA